MAGLSLRGNVGAYFGAPMYMADGTSSNNASSPPVNPAVPASLAATPRAATISSRAYGVNSGGAANPYVSTGMISTYVAVGSVLGLLFLWHSLPR